MKNNITYRLKVLLIISYIICIYLFSEYKFPVTTGTGDKPSFDIFPFLHMGEFGLLSVLLMFVFYGKIDTYVLLIVSISYGILDEVHQYFIPYRWFDYKDIIYNSIGSILGIIGFFVLLLIYSYLFVFPKIRWGNRGN